MHRTVVIVPYRNTPDNSRRLQREKLSSVLTDAGLDYIVVEQTPGCLFNRGLLLNVGHLAAMRMYGSSRLAVIFHDVDLIPTPHLLSLYKRWPTGLTCLYTPHRYTDDANFFGGVGSVDSAHQERVNGFPNLFSGWGGEDQEWGRRMRAAKVPVERPMQGRHTHVDMECLSLDEKMTRLRADGGKCRFKRELLQLYRSAALHDGLDTVEKVCSWKFVTRQQVLVNPKSKIFSERPTDAEQVAAWAKRVCMDPRRRKLEMQNRLRRKLDKPEITEEQQRVSEVMANPGEFLRNLNPSTIQTAMKAMDLKAYGGLKDDAKAPPAPLTAKSRRAKRKKKKNASPSKQSDGNSAELTPELPPPVTDF